MAKKRKKVSSTAQKVGRGNPPKHTQFRKGTTGNPKGRPKGARNKLGEDFIQALYEDFQVHGLESAK